MVAKWTRLNWAQRLVLFEAAWNLAAAHVAIRLLPFRWIAPGLGSPGDAPPERPISQAQQIEAKQVGWAIMAQARYFPWDAKCLSQAVAGKWMLHRRGLTSTLYLGVERAHGGEKWLDAHAWLRCGSDVVTGERHHERFKVLAAFTEERL
jgi:hypothetical protein